MAERPKDLIYARDEKPPPVPLIAIGFQHVAVICPYLVMVALVAEAAKLPQEAARNAMGLAMIAVAFLTVLQSLRLGRIGSGYLCPPVVSAIYLPSAMLAASVFGFPVACGMVIFAGGCEVAVGGLVNSLRKFFPAVVSGVVIIAVGIELGKIGLGVLLDPKVTHDARVNQMFLTALCVLVTMIALAVWAKGLPKLLCVLIGILLGYVVAALLQVFPKDFSVQLSQSPIFAFPNPRFLSYGFEPSLMLPFAIAGLASGLRVVGVLTTCQQMNDAAWRRPDMESIAGGVIADGIGCVVGGVLAAPGMSASPSLVGIEKITGVTSRVIAWSIAGWLLALSCLPQFRESDRQYAAAGDGSRIVFQWITHVCRRYPDRGEPAHHSTRLVDYRPLFAFRVVGSVLSGILQIFAILDASVHGVRNYRGRGGFHYSQRALPARILAL